MSLFEGFGGADDDDYSVFEAGVVDEGGVEGVASEMLREEAISAQRLSVLRGYRAHMEGRAHVSVVHADRKMSPEKIFSIGPLFDWTEKEPTAIIAALRAGRVRARVSAAMGVGKSTSFGPYIVDELGLRVLIVSVDANCMSQAGEYIARVGIGRYKKNWPTKTGGGYCAMTYADFRGFMVGGDRSRLFSSFDVVIFDESFASGPDVFSAKRCFAAFAHPSTSLLMCSATIRTDRGSGDGGAGGLGAVKQVAVTVSVDEAIAKGRLVTEYLVDRTLVLVPTTRDIDALRQHYVLNGVDVKCLDDASTRVDEREVEDWLLGDSSTPRVLIAHVAYGLGFNFHLSFAVVWPLREVKICDGNVLRTELRPMSDDMVTQCVSRVGRGLVAGSSALVMVVERGPACELYEDERHVAFVQLFACGIVPMTNGAWASSYELFPGGLTSQVASRMLKLPWPPEVVARFFCDDGFVARKYVAALNVFAQPDHFLMPSKHDEPKGVEEWPLDSFGDEMSGAVVQRVPVLAKGEFQVVMHAVVAMANGDLKMTRWRPSGPLRDLGYDSGAEQETSRRAVGRLRRYDDAPVKPIEYEVASSTWSYQPMALKEGNDVKRGGRFVDTDRFREAVAKLNATLDTYVVPDVACEVIPSPVSDERVFVELPAVMSVVESPGGSPVCELDRAVCGKLHRGQVVEPKEMLNLIWAAKSVMPGFVASRLFDNLAGPWESVLRSLDDVDVVAYVVTNGEATVAYRMVDWLRGRFNHELFAVLSSSNTLRTRFRRIFSRAPSPQSIMKAIHAGKFDNIGQTSAFFDRVRLIKRLIDKALLRAEGQNVYLPHHITAAQRMLYVGPSALPSVGHGVHSQVRLPIRRHSRASSDATAVSDRLRARQGPHVDWGLPDVGDYGRS